jgi:hypothetical protein
VRAPARRGLDLLQLMIFEYCGITNLTENSSSPTLLVQRIGWPPLAIASAIHYCK